MHSQPCASASTTTTIVENNEAPLVAQPVAASSAAAVSDGRTASVMEQQSASASSAAAVGDGPTSVIAQAAMAHVVDMFGGVGQELGGNSMLAAVRKIQQQLRHRLGSLLGDPHTWKFIMEQVVKKLAARGMELHSEQGQQAAQNIIIGVLILLVKDHLTAIQDSLQLSADEKTLVEETYERVKEVGPS